MSGTRALGLMLLAALVAVAGCSRNEAPQLMHLKTTRGPDEFNFVPNKPIEMPEDLAALPAPTPGGTNRVDQTPEADAIAALGGRPSLLVTAGIPSADNALIAQTTRFGTAADIRQNLAAEDLEFRRQNNGRFLERLLNVTVYYESYSEQSLDQHAELARWRRAGVRTVSAPPSREE